MSALSIPPAAPLAILVLALFVHISNGFAPSSRVKSQPSLVGTATSSPLFRPNPANTACNSDRSPLHLSSDASDEKADDDTSTSTSSAITIDAKLGAWIPLGSASSLAGLSPVQIKICGLNLAVWHKPLPDGSKRNAVPTEWSAMVDACPHRLAPLSQGRVDPETCLLECPYHGWSFDSNGDLKVLPQLDEGRSIEAGTGGNGAATVLPIHKAGDLLFVFMPTELCGESWPIERLPEHHYNYLQADIDKGKTYYTRELPYSMDFLIENFMDPAHIPFAHHSLQGTRDDGSPIEMTVGANNFTHVEATFIDICRGKQRDGVLSFQRPSLYHFRTRANETAEYKPNLLIYIAPVEAGKCRVVFPDISIPFVPTFLGHAGSNRFLNTDTWLHDAERLARIDNDLVNKQSGVVAVGAARGGKKATEGLNYIFSSKADLGPSLFREWWSTHGFAKAPPNTFGPATADQLTGTALSRAEQIDPWDNHAKHCSKCRRALGRMRKLQKLSIALSTVGAVLLRNKPFLASGGILFGLWLHNFLRKLATTIEGNNHRSH